MNQHVLQEERKPNLKTSATLRLRRQKHEVPLCRAQASLQNVVHIAQVGRRGREETANLIQRYLEKTGLNQRDTIIVEE